MKSKTRLSAAFLAIAMTLSTAACPIFSFAASEEDASDWVVESPDGMTVMSIDQTEDGGLSYSVTQDGVMIVEASDLGINTSVGDFTAGLVYDSQKTEVFDGTYTISGQNRTYVNRYTEIKITFMKAAAQFDLIARAYDDGIAFRYVITDGSKDTMTIAQNAEITSFNIPNDSRIWYMPRTGNDFMYEDNYQTGKIGQVAIGTQPSLPMLYEVGNKYGLIMEADRHGTYTGSLLRLEADGEMRTIFDLTQKTAVSTASPFTSPWRTVIIGSAAEIMANTMVENLSPEPAPNSDFSWVNPGLASWSWVSYYGGQKDPDIHKHFIDLAADMGWEYYILDEEWQPRNKTRDENDPKKDAIYEGMWNWFDDVKAHADQKGVKLIAWVNKKDVDTAEERQARFSEWSQKGIVGIKVDFFYNDNQSTLQLYDDLYRDAAANKLMVNVHGGNPSSGEIRTWPNVITREAIRGQEQGGITAEQYTLIPFIRAAVGSADVTEQLYSRDTGKTSMGFQIALSTIIENGLHSIGSKPEEYYSVPEAVSYYKNFPDVWDEMKVLDAKVGERVNVARRSDNVWYAAGIAVEQTIFSYKMSFLTPGEKYMAILYSEDGASRTGLKTYIYENVTSTSSVLVQVQKGGGYAIKFVPMGQVVTDITVADTADDKEAKIEVELFQTKEIALTTTPADSLLSEVTWSIADAKIAKVTGTGEGASIFATKEGTTTLTATSIYDDEVIETIELTVTPETLHFNDTDWVVLNDNGNYEITGKNSVVITTENGVIDNNIFAMKAEHEDFEITAKISGGLSQNYQGGFIGVFTKDEKHEPFVAVGRRYHTMFDSGGSTPNNHIAVLSSKGNDEKYKADPNVNGDVYVRLVKEGDTFTGYYRENKTDEWSEAFSIENADLANSEMYVGFWAGNGGSDNTTEITISEFTYNGKMVKVANAVEDTGTYEAEDAAVDGGAKLVSNVDASSDYYVDLGDSGDATVTYTINRSFASKATLRIYYYASEASKLSLNVNGETMEIDCPATTDWDTLREPIELEIQFVKGENKIVLSGVDGSASPDVDYIDVVCIGLDKIPKLVAGIRYEMEDGTINGNASILDVYDVECSNDQCVVNLNSNSSVVFDIYSDTAVNATINIYYATASNRFLSVSVNGSVQEIECERTSGEWYATGAEAVIVDARLEEGVNTIVFSGVVGKDAPNLDYFIITLGDQITADEATPDSAATSTMTLRTTGTNTVEAEAATLSGGADVVNAAASSNGQRIGNIGGPNNGTATFSLTSEVETDATMNVYYATAQNRKLSVTVNDEVYSVDCPSTGSWDQSGTPVELDVHLEEGENTVAFGGVNGEWAPNLDEFTIELEQYESAEGSYEMEDGELSGSAQSLKKSGCSNGYRLGDVGGPDNGSATFEIEHDADGMATIMVYYATVGARDLGITVNGKLYTVNCPTTGGWNAPGKTPVAVTVELKKGVNTIVFGGVNNEYAPNLDKFEIVTAVLSTVTETYEMEKGIVANGANITSNANVSGGRRVGNVGGASNGNVTFTVSCDVAGMSTIRVYYATLNTRKLSVMVNGKTYTVDCTATGGWNKVGEPVEIEVQLKAGDNTIVFGGVNGGWAPNLDKFEITMQKYV